MSDNEARLIVGLGNPGEEYQTTRHNLGFLVVEQLVKEFKVKFQKSSFTKALIAEIENRGSKIIFCLPLTYMNQSGFAVKDVVDQRQVHLKDILVICDDMNLDFGQLRLRSKGSDGGHNGVSSIIEHLGTDQFPRLRLGIGQAPQGKDSAQYVLEELTSKEKKQLPGFVLEASECVNVWLNQGVHQAMDRYNQRKEYGQE